MNNGTNGNFPQQGFPTLVPQVQANENGTEGAVQQPQQVVYQQPVQMSANGFYQPLQDPELMRGLLRQGTGAYRVQIRLSDQAQMNQPQPTREGQQRFFVQHTAPVPMQQTALHAGATDMFGRPQYPGMVTYIQPAQGMDMRTPFLAGVPVAMNQMQRPQFLQPVVAVDEATNPGYGEVTIMQMGQPAQRAEEPQRRKQKKRKRNANKPKPARYAWNFYFKEQYQKIRNDGGSGLFDVQEAFTKIGEKLGNRWKSLSAEERQPYLDMATADKARYEREMEKYRLGLDFREDTKAIEAKAKQAKEEKEKETTNKEEPKDDAGPKEAEEHKEAAAGTNSETKPVEQIDASGVTADILVTDDDDTFIVMMELTLNRLNQKFKGVKLNIEKAANGEEAIRKVVDEKRKYACITVDKEMGPGADGYEVVQQMRKSGYDGGILGVTGNKNCEDGFEKKWC